MAARCVSWKFVTNDMYLVHCEGNVRLTRSVKSIYKDWSDQMGLYRTLVVQSWQIEGTLGNRIDPVGGNVVPDAVPALDDEAGPDLPEAEGEAAPETPALIPTAVLQRGMKPPPMFAAVAGPVTPAVSEPHAGIQAERMPTAMFEEDTPMDNSGSGERQDQQQGEVAEPSAKRQKLTMRRIDGEELYHMDSEPYDNFDGLEVDEFYSYDSLYNIDSSYEFEDQVQGDATTKIASGPSDPCID